MESKDLLRSYAALVNSAYPGFLERMGYPNTAGHASASRITASNGDVFLDCIAGYGLFGLGHNHPEIVNALKTALDRGMLATRPFVTEEQVTAALDLQRICPGDLNCSFMCNSGSEAVDTAIKLARFCTGRGKIISARNSFHGYTFGALSVSGMDSFKKGFDPMVPECIHVEYGDPDDLEQHMDENTAAVLLEPLQHEAGVVFPPKGYFPRVRSLCDQYGSLMILDEIKTGLGRTGAMFGCGHFDVVPDVMLLGKTLGGGLIPAGAVVAKKRIWRRTGYSFSLFASSYSGNALACTAASTVIRILENTDIVETCAKNGKYLYQGFNAIKHAYPDLILRVTGKGLLLSIETSAGSTALKLIQKLSGKKILTAPAFGNGACIMIEPPLVITRKDIDRLLTDLEDSCKTVKKNE